MYSAQVDGEFNNAQCPLSVREKAVKVSEYHPSDMSWKAFGLIVKVAATMQGGCP